MNCPNDNTTLVMTDRAGIEIDYCPQCRGVWLDRGELDKIIERSDAAYGHSEQAGQTPGVRTSKPIPSQEYFTDSQTPPQFSGPNHTDDDHRYHKGYDKEHYDPRYKKHKKESFLGNLFDI